MNSSRLFTGPRFLWQDEESWPQSLDLPASLPDHDPEIRKDSAVYVSQIDCNQIFDRIMKKRSSWFELKKDVGYILRMKCFLKSKANKLSLPDISRPFTVAELAEVELHIVRYVQQETFIQEMKTLSKGSADTTVQRSSALYRLEPVMHEDGLIHVSGRLPSHPIIIPNQHDVTNLIIRHFHIVCGHGGKEHTLAQVRVIRGRSAVHRVLSGCARCKLRDVKPVDQRMADLPADRITAGEPPFSYTGVDVFGPFNVKLGRSVVKRYGCIFTCLRIRAIHIEVIQSLDTDSFINALQRFICRRGEPKELRSDNATNFIGAERELRVAVSKWNTNRIHTFLQRKAIE